MNMQAAPKLSFARKMIHVLSCLEDRRNLIEDALVYGDTMLTYDTVCARILSGQYDLYPLSKSVIVGETIQQGEHKSYMLVIGAGELDELLAYLPHIYELAKGLGCKKIYLNGRMGWAKALKNDGWSTSYITMSRDLES